jgi:hypothetical protein
VGPIFGVLLAASIEIELDPSTASFLLVYRLGGRLRGENR